MQELKGESKNPRNQKKRVLILVEQAKPSWVFKYLSEFDFRLEVASVRKGLVQGVILGTINQITRSCGIWSSYDFIISWGFLRGILVSIALRMYAMFGFRTPDHLVISVGGALWPRSFQSIAGMLMRDNTFVCFSRAERDILINQFGLQQVYFVPLGVDVNYWTPSATHDEYVFSGGMTARDYSTLFSAVRSINFKFIIAAGKDPVTGRIGFRREEIPPNVIVYYDVPISKFRELLSNCLFVVIPLRETKYTAGQGVLLQAFACGKAVISSRVVGTIDYVEEGKNGFLVGPGDSQALGEMIQYLLNHRDICTVVGTNARILAYERFSEEALANSISEIIRQIESHKNCEKSFQDKVT